MIGALGTPGAWLRDCARHPCARSGWSSVHVARGRSRRSPAGRRIRLRDRLPRPLALLPRVGGLLLLLAGCQPTEPHPQKVQPLFTDVTTDSRIDFVHVQGGTGRRYLPETMGAGGCVLDFDGDGFMDVFLVQSGPIPGAGSPALSSRLYRNVDGKGFVEQPYGMGAGWAGYGQGAIAGDFDGDGDPDLHLTGFGKSALLQNQGSGRFEDVTRKAGLEDGGWSSSSAFLDADGDGDLDLYVARYLDYSLETHRDCVQQQTGASFYCHPDVYPPAPDAYYRNRGDGTYEDATEEAGLRETTGKGLGVVVADLDNDGDPDIYVANDSTPNFLYRNLGGGRFEEAGLLLGVSHNADGKTEAGMGVDAGDVDGDGRLDLFVTNLSLEANALYLGGMDAYRYATREAGLYGPSLPVLGFGADLLDLDNDGDLDIFVNNGDVLDNIELFNDGLSWRQPGHVFLNDGRGRFSKLPEAAAGDVSVPRVGRGSMTLDYDNDGRLDILACYGNDRARLYRNTGQAGRWVGLHLLDRQRRSLAVGARATVTAGGRTLFDEVKSGSSYLTSSDPRLHFGLGSASEAVDVRIRWPDGRLQEIGTLAAGHYYRIVEDQPPVRLD